MGIRRSSTVNQHTFNKLKSNQKYYGMDKIGEGNKPFEARVEDLMEDQRQKEHEKDNISDDSKEGTEKIMDEMKFGVDFVFRMSDPVIPGEDVPKFSCKALVGDSVKIVSKEDYEGSFFLMIFFPKDFTREGEDILRLVADLLASKEFNIELLLISTDSVATHRAFRESMGGRNGGAPAVSMLGDTTGDVAKMFGVLDTITHLAYSAMFLIDMRGLVQAVKVYGWGGLVIGGAGEVLDLVREAFTVEGDAAEEVSVEGKLEEGPN